MKPFDTDRTPWLFTPHDDGELDEFFMTSTPYSSAASRQLTPYLTISKRFIVPPFLRKKRRPAH